MVHLYGCTIHNIRHKTANTHPSLSLCVSLLTLHWCNINIHLTTGLMFIITSLLVLLKPISVLLTHQVMEGPHLFKTTIPIY